MFRLLKLIRTFLDIVEPAVVTISFEHHEVHEGNFYTASIYDADVDAGEAAAKEILLITPNTAKRIHIKVQITGTGAGFIQLTENPTVSVGNVVIAYNNNRNSTNETTLVIKQDPTVTADGTIIFQNWIPAETKGKIGGVVRLNAEWDLEQNEDYLIRVVSDADNNKVSIVIELYEV